MAEEKTAEPEAGTVPKADLYRDPNYTSLYRYENPTIPYDEGREGIVSKKDLIGTWYTDNLDDLKAYSLTRIQGKRGGKFVVIRVKEDELDKYDATKKPEMAGMDFESGNYLVPDEISSESRVEVEGIFKDSWEGRPSIPLADYQEVGDYINKNLSAEAIVARLETQPVRP